MTDLPQATTILKKGGIGVLATDTLYGIVGSALHKETVERIYHTRKRDSDKPLIVLVGNMNDLALFNISLTDKDRAVLEKIWPGKISVIVDCLSQTFEYLHRGTQTLALRLPQNETLRAIIRETGPLVAPSANTQGNKPAETIAEARDYFGDKVDFYVDTGLVQSAPSTIVSLKDGNLSVLREGEAMGVIQKLL